MTWFRHFGPFELTAALVFLALYAAYAFRIFRTARTLQVTYAGAIGKLVLRTAALALLIVAFLGPASGESKKEVKVIGKDIVICVDLSKSMDAFDVQPTRIERVKFELKRIVDAFSSDRIGLIIFSSEAFVQSPLTHDQNALNLFIGAINTGLVPPSGTDFGPPLRLALNKLIGEGEGSSKPKSKIILLISDGEDFGDDTDDVVDRIKNDGIALYTLGVGSREGGRIRDNVGFKKDKDGQDIVTRLNSSSLESLAERTGGAYFEISDAHNDIARLIRQVGQVEGELKDIRQLDAASNRYSLFLFPALCLILIDTIVGLKLIRL